MSRNVFSVFLFLFSFCYCNAQPDNILWASTQIRKQFSPDWSLQVQPIFRFNQDFGAHQNTSIDVSLRRNLGSQWFVQVLSRTWFVPDRDNRQFIWLDLGHRSKLSQLQLSWTNRIRYHQALDLSGNHDTDYLRFMTQFIPTTSWRLKPTIGVEIWWELNDVNQSISNRIEPGLRYQFSNKFGLTFIWRRQNFVSDDIASHDNLWVVAVVYNL